MDDYELNADKSPFQRTYANQVSASLDVLLDVAAGKINIHVLMALAAFASVFMGNSLEGALLLAMFNLAHIAEEYFTNQSMIDVKELKDNYPEFALVLEGDDDGPPQFSNLNYTKIPVFDLEVGSYILVKAGELMGEVHQGASTVTIEHLTGESKPLEIKMGDRVPAGARNLEGVLIVKVVEVPNVNCKILVDWTILRGNCRGLFNIQSSIRRSLECLLQKACYFRPS